MSVTTNPGATTLAVTPNRPSAIASDRPLSSVGYATPAAFAAKLEQQRTELTASIASPTLMRDDHGRSLVAAG
jgi:hypothetical protein